MWRIMRWTAVTVVVTAAILVVAAARAHGGQTVGTTLRSLGF
jgi:hypothetical protein